MPKRLPTSPRVSSLPGLLSCPAFAALRSVQERTESPAANTGTAAGRIIELLHRGYFYEDAALQAEQEAAEGFPMADLDLAEKLTRLYSDDPRNVPTVTLESGDDGVVGELCELEVTYDLPPIPEDPTGEVIRLVGHVDQIRRVNGQLHVWDVKAGKPAGRDMEKSYFPQLAAYALACTQTLGEPVLPGGIIRIRGYVWSNRCKWDKENLADAPVFFHTPATLDTCRDQLASVAVKVALFRMGIVTTEPGPHCNWCVGHSPGECPDVISTTFGA